MDLFLRLDLASTVYFLELTWAPPAPPPDDWMERGAAFLGARQAAGDLAAPCLVLVDVGGFIHRTPVGVSPAEAAAAARAALQLGTAGRAEQATARYGGAAPFAPLD